MLSRRMCCTALSPLVAVFAVACGSASRAGLPASVGDRDLEQIHYASDVFQEPDLRRHDFSAVTWDDMLTRTFANNTVWAASARLPAGFDPRAALETGLDPGLGVREMHRNGITGLRVAVAVIDKPIPQDHVEFGIGWSIVRWSQVMVYPTFTDQRRPPYRPVPDAEGCRADGYVRALELILEGNATGTGPRVDVVSISDGFKPGTSEAARVDSAIWEAERAGIVVVHCGQTFALAFSGAGCPPGLDRDTGENYGLWLHFVRSVDADTVRRRFEGEMMVPGLSDHLRQCGDRVLYLLGTGRQ